ncbi:MAG: PP2C family protein-serine/threonine phosphatase [Phycisphaerae bacterium]
MLDESALDIENAVSAHLMRESQKMEEELLQARAVQRYLLPPEVQEHAGFRTAFVYHPLHHVGGDFLDTLLRPDGKLVLMIGDVSGHGMAAALSSAMLKTAFLRHAPGASGPGHLLSLIDAELHKTVRFGRFVTAMIAWFDVATRTLTVSSAGHPPALLMRRGEVSRVEAEPHLPLFTGDAVEYPDAPAIQMLPEDRLLLMTDGVLEATRSSGEMITTDEVSKVVSSCPVDGNFAACIFESLFFSDLVFNDDVSLLALEVR